MTNRDFDIVIVAALDEGRTIGRDGQLPWHLPADLAHFKETTMGHPLVMGRKTREAIGTALPGRNNIVLTRQSGLEYSDSTVVGSLEEAFDCVEGLGADRAMVIGGASLFERLVPVADRMVLTVVKGHHDGDVFFPDFDADQWRVVDVEPRSADEDNPRDMVFVELRADAEPPRTVGSTERGGPLPEKLADLVGGDDRG